MAKHKLAIQTALDVSYRLGQRRPKRIGPYFLVYSGARIEGIVKDTLIDASEIIDKHTSQCIIGMLAISMARITHNQKALKAMLLDVPFGGGHIVDVDRDELVSLLQVALDAEQLAMIEIAFMGFNCSYMYNAKLSSVTVDACIDYADRHTSPTDQAHDIVGNMVYNDGLFLPHKPLPVMVDARD